MAKFKLRRAPFFVAVAGGIALAIVPATAALPFAPVILAQTQARLAVCPSAMGALGGDYRAEAVQLFPDGFTAYYTAMCAEPNEAPQPGEGFRVFRRVGLGWRDIGGEDISYYDAGCINPPAPGQWVCCTVSAGEEGNYTAVFGRAVSPDVTQVEVMFDNGNTAHAPIVNHKFAVANPGITGLGRLRVFDHAGVLLDDVVLDVSARAQAEGTTGCRP